MITELPNRIEVTIQEEDRLNAGEYRENYNCIMATALKRMGYNHDTQITVYPGFVSIGDCFYNGELYAHRLEVDDFAITAPYYRSSVVGKTFVLTKDEGRK